jgi:histidinol-phosphate phosphatase family protein
LADAKRRAVFLDLNGTLVLPIRAQHPRDYQPILHASDAVAHLCKAGFACPVVTVQNRVEKGFYTETEFLEWFGRFRAAFAEHGAFLLGPYLCPHRFSTPCACKKAGGQLYERAAEELSIDLPSSFVVGDTLDDMAAARRIGCRGVMVRTGWQVESDAEASCDCVADDLLVAAEWIADAARQT